MTAITRGNSLGVGGLIKRKNPLTLAPAGIIRAAYHRAPVAELVDAPASGAGSRKGVEVRVFSGAPSHYFIQSDIVQKPLYLQGFFVIYDL